MNKLLSIAPPPQKPVGTGTPSQWTELENHWRFQFPEDYKRFISTYGNGRFTDFFGIPSPFHTPKRDISFEKFVKLRLDGVLYSQREMPNHAADLPTYPNAAGLFPIGYTDNGGTIFWLMKGEPRHWPVVCMRCGYTKDYDMFEVTAVAFLEGWLTGKIPVPSLTPLGFFPLRIPVFVPSVA